MKLTPEAIIAENKKRVGVFNKEYDPYRGIGTYIPRFKITLGSFGIFYFPTTMKDLPYIKAVLSGKKKVTKLLFAQIQLDRKKYDFEYYAFTHLFIKPKKGGDEIPFKLNYPQRAILWPAIYDDIENGRPIRLNLVKARQWGGSTEIDGVTYWIQREVKTGWNSCIVADVEEQARNIRGMTTTFARYYPTYSGTTTLKNFEGSSKNKFIEETGNLISIGSMQRPESLRSGDIKMCHLSEVGLWKSTLGKKPEDLIQSLRGTIPDEPYTLFALESTAKGIGNYFHREYLACIEGRSDLTLVFVGWWQIEQYQKAIKGSVKKFIESWDEYEKWLWGLGATIEGIYWYRHKLYKEFKGDTWRMGSEFPSTAQEAFQSTGSRYYPPAYVQNLRRFNREPEFVGELTAKENYGPECLNKIEFNPQPEGRLKVWAKPDNSINVSNRYAIAIDVGGRNPKADFSVIKVLDRLNLLYGDIPEVVAVWVGRMDYDLVAWKGAQIATWYNKGLLIPESNYFDNKTEYREGDQMFTILNTISDHYDNLYTRTTPDRIKEGAPVQWGFHMNSQTKPMVLATSLEYLRELRYVETHARCCDEYDSYEIKPDGKFGAADGSHDDELMCTVILIWVHENRMDPPRIIVHTDKPYTKRITNESSF